MWRPLACQKKGKGCYSLVVSEARFGRFYKITRFKKKHTYIVLCWPNADVLVLVFFI